METAVNPGSGSLAEPPVLKFPDQEVSQDPTPQHAEWRPGCTPPTGTTKERRGGGRLRGADPAPPVTQVTETPRNREQGSQRLGADTGPVGLAQSLMLELLGSCPRLSAGRLLGQGLPTALSGPVCFLILESPQ